MFISIELDNPKEFFFFWQIGEISKPIILDWVIAQHSCILEWTGRASDFEVGSMWIWIMLFENVFLEFCYCLVRCFIT